MSAETSSVLRGSFSHRSVLPFAAALVMSLTSCSHRADEPTPDPPAPQRAADSDPAEPKKPPGRCIMQTPSTPQREVVGVVPDPACPADPDGNPNLAVSVVRFPEARGADAGSLEVGVEIADKDKDRMRGLMYRKALAKDAGMLFVFDDTEVSKFWMKNTCIPLDMIFIAEDGLIVGIEENTPTLSEDTFTANCPDKYVLEVNAGWARKNGVRAGQKALIVR